MGHTYEKEWIGEQFDEERALYHLQNGRVKDCIFAGPADGESVLKEAGDIAVEHCSFSLRYPMWHVKGFELTGSSMDELTRAALWYADHGRIIDCRLHGIKAVRECSDMENLAIENCHLDTKDAFWHSKNVTVKDSVVKGEYLAWFSEGLTLINCKIIGTQPLCYCKNLKLVNCTMEETDLAFEYSEVEADVRGNVLSIKNPKGGTITVDSVGEIIMEDAVMECTGNVVVRA